MTNIRRTSSLNNSEKIEALNKENQMLLDRLLHISSKTGNKSLKRKTKRKDNVKTSNSHNTLAYRHRSVRPKSLNLQARIIEDQKIREENIKIAQRLFTKKPVLDFKALKDQYVEHK
uniref:Uncharacterized protein n=1 Tax=Euplotes crassus TaxID=5936 RepID=A0A7S3KSA7_EUPCR|mmetsp:Transcript_38349/g.37864  ORF Transcript_38349/g.37864 Transcript_38349/m.37864 type:complete len:117 (+) Transcript_38349:182-532(+)